MRKHFVEFLSPGTLVTETTREPIDQWDTHLAAEMARSITERHGAKPYGFQFVTCIVADAVPDGEGGTLKVQPKEVERSGTHYITGVLLFYHEIHDRDRDILKSNMKGNKWPICIENRNSYRFTSWFSEKDIILDREGNVIRRGDDPQLVGYRRQTISDWEAEAEPAYLASINAPDVAERAVFPQSMIYEEKVQ